MPSNYLIKIALEILKKGTGAKDVDTELKGVDTTVKKVQDSWKKFAAAGASVAAALYTVKKAFDFGKEGAIITQTRDSFDGLIQKLGAAPDTLDKLRTAARGTVDDMTLMSSTSTLLAGTQGELATQLAGATPQLMEIAKAANKLNPTLGDTTFLYQSLATGIKRSSPLILDNLGLTIKIGEANEAFAKSMGKTVEQLSAEEQKMALLKATLDAGNVMIEQAGGSTEAAADSFAAMEAQLKNVVDQFKVQLAPVIMDLIPIVESATSAFANFLIFVGGRTPEALVDVTQESREAGLSLKYLAEEARNAKAEMLWGKDAAFFGIDMSDKVKLTGEELLALGEASGATFEDVKALADEIGVKLDLESWQAYADSLDDVEKAAAAQREGLEANIQTAEKAVHRFGAVAKGYEEEAQAAQDLAEAQLRNYDIEQQALASAKGLTFAHEEARTAHIDAAKAALDHAAAMAVFTRNTDQGQLGIQRYGAALAASSAEKRKAAEMSEELAAAEDALAGAVGAVMARYEAFYGTLAQGLISFRDLGAAQEQSAQDYEQALANLEQKQRSVTQGMQMNFQAALPDATDVAQRLGMAEDAWDEWGLRLQDIINQGVASPWYATLQQMGMEKPPDTGVKEWAEDLKKAFYAGEVPDLLPPEWAANVRSQQQEATAAFHAEAAKRKAAVQEEIDALNAAREAQLEQERQARNEATIELALSLAEQTGQLQAWSTQEFGPDFSTVADSAGEVMGLLQSGMLEVDGSLQGLLERMVTGLGTVLDSTGQAAEDNKAKLQEIAEYDPFAEMEANKQAVIDAFDPDTMPFEDLKTKLGEVEAAYQAIITPTEEGVAEDPFAAMLTSFQGAQDAIIDGAGTLSDEVIGSLQNIDTEAGTIADSVMNYFVGNSAFPDIANGAMNMSNLTVAAFMTMQSVGVAAGQSVGQSWATGLQAAQQELKKMVAQLKSLPTEIEIHLTTVVTGGPDLQHGGQWTVRGPGGIDNVPVAFMATAGETVTVTPRSHIPPRGFQGGGQFTVPGMAQTVTVQGDTNNWYINDPGSVALAMRLAENRRRDRLNEFMGVG